MKTSLKALLAAVLFTATASTAFAESYEVNSVDGGVKISVSLQGAGTIKIPGTGQHLFLHADHTMTGSIYAINDGGGHDDLFALSGAWYRPEGSKVIYYALDGDPTKGAASDGNWGSLFDPARATILPLQEFMPVLFRTKVSALAPIYPTILLKTGIIKLTIVGDQIKSATTNMTITGRAMISFCKKAVTPACTIPDNIKDSAFSFSAITKSTVAVNPPEDT